MKPGRGLTIALVISLVLNLFLVGAGAGAWILAHRLGQAHPAAQRAPLWRAADELPPAHRQAWRAFLRDHALQAAPILHDARDQRYEAWDMLLKPTVDIPATKAQLAKARARTEDGRAVIEDAIVDFGSTLPVEERLTLLKGLKRVTAGQSEAEK
jgi:uncharacterized membrane protein